MRVVRLACVCVLVYKEEGGRAEGFGSGEFGHPSALGYFATVSADAHRHTHADTHANTQHCAHTLTHA